MSDERPEIQDEDERKLAELGYKQELGRSWSGFANFAISFSIISVLSGCFTNYALGWANGGPIVMGLGWPIVALIILTVAVSMSELASAFPTAGGPYWWASKLGGPGWAWYTGWFNVLGLIAIVGSVTYGAALFASTLFSVWELDLGVISFVIDDANPNLVQEQFIVFFVFLVILAAINIFSSHLVALLSSISVWWHVFGVAVVIAILVFIPDQHQSVSFAFTERLSLNGFSDGAYWILVLPLGLMYVVMYTITGYDASAHVAEETKSAEMAAARGIWQSVAYSAVIGWFLLLAFNFAATDVEAINAVFGFSPTVFLSAMPGDEQIFAELVILISVIGQLFCGMACITSCSRTLFAFSRDRAVPAHGMLSKVDHRAVPRNAVIWSCLHRTDHQPPGPVRPAGGRCAHRVLRGGLDRDRGLVHRVRHPGLPEAPGGRSVHAGLVEPGQQVQVDQHDRDRVGRDLGRLLRHADGHVRDPGQRCLRPVAPQLRAHPARPHRARDHDLVVRERQEDVHRSGAHDRVRRSDARRLGARNDLISTTMQV